MVYSSDIIKELTKLGALSYPLSKVVNVLDIAEADIPQFTLDFDNPDHICYKSYHKGIDKAEFTIELRIFDKAQKGDLDAIKEYESRKKVYADKEKKDKELRDWHRNKATPISNI